MRSQALRHEIRGNVGLVLAVQKIVSLDQVLQFKLIILLADFGKLVL